jgi:hypothetical protein
MRIHARVAAIAFSLICLAAAPALLAQQSPQQPPAAPRAAASDNTLSGDLTKVDSAAKTITVKAADGKETTLAYNDATTVTGARDVAGLATMKDQKVTVTFTEDAASKAKTATKIAVQPRAQ